MAGTGTMRAAVVASPGVMAVVEKPVPEPGPGEVLVRVQRASLCGTDLKIRKGSFFERFPAPGTFTPGHEYAGTVVGLGLGVDEFEPGDRVVAEAHRGCMQCQNCLRGEYTSCLNYGRPDKGHRAMGMTVDGGFADYAVNHVSTLHRLPDHVGFDEAVILTTVGTVMHAVDVLPQTLVGATTAVIGPGPIGLLVVQVVRQLGAERIFLVGTRKSKLDLGMRFGADLAVNVNEADPVAVVLEATGGLGVEYVFECSGAPSAVDHAVRITRRAGTIVLVGFFEERVSVDLDRVVKNGIRILSVRGEGTDSVARAVTLADRGRLEIAPLITHHFPLEEISEAFDTFAYRREEAIKVILDIAPNEPGGKETGWAARLSTT